MKIEGTLERDALAQAIRRVVREAEPARAAIFEVDGQVFQTAIDYPDIELDFYDLSRSRRPVQEARRIAESIQRTPMSFTGPLFKVALFQTWDDEFYLFACGHHVVIDGSGITLVCHRITSVYSAIVSDAPIPPSSSARCRTWFAASWNMKRPTIMWKIRRIGAGTFPESGGHYGCPRRGRA